MGNDPTSTAGSSNTPAPPGVVVLHDFVLHHLVCGLTLGAGPRGYLAAMERDAGVAGRLLAWVIDGCILRPGMRGRRTFRSAARCSSWRRVSSSIPTSSSGGAGAGTTDPSAGADACVAGAGGRAVRRRGLAVFGAFGHMNASKRIPQLLRAFGRFRASHADARLLLVGSVAPELDLAWRIDHSGLGDAVVWED
jgi:hypothetical protein